MSNYAVQTRLLKAQVGEEYFFIFKVKPGSLPIRETSFLQSPYLDLTTAAVRKLTFIPGPEGRPTQGPWQAAGRSGVGTPELETV